MPQLQDWLKSFYEVEVLADLLLERSNSDELHNTLQFLQKHLSIQPGDTVFDQGCGIGSISIPLAKKGIRVIGVDLSQNYIERAKKQVQENDLSCDYRCANALDFVSKTPCDAAWNWFTSFGYHLDDKINIKMLKCAFRSLKPGGKFVIDYQNIANIIKNFKTTITKEGISGGRKVVLTRDCRLNFVTGMIEQQWNYVFDNEKIIRKSFLKMYLPHQLKFMLEQVGFFDVVIYGDLAENELTSDSSRCLCLARKPQ